MALTLTEAHRMVQAALAKAQELNVKISVAVCDTGGNLMALNRMDGASAVRIGKSNGIFTSVSTGAHPRSPAAWTPQRLYVPLPAPAGQRAGEVWGASPGYPWGESRRTAGRRGGRMAPGQAQAHRHARGLCGAHVADRTTLAWA